MAVVEFKYSELKKEINMPKGQLVEVFNSIGAPSEEREEMIVVELTPNRPDMFSKQGLIRAAKSFLGKEVGLKKYSSKKSEYKIIVEKSVAPVRPFVCAAVVKGLQFNDERIREIMQL